MKYQFGWLGPKEEAPVLEAFASRPDHPIVDTRMVDWDGVATAMQTDSDPKGKRFAFWDSVIKLTGKHLPNTNQLLGDCVAAATEMGLEYLLADQIVRSGHLQQYRPVFRPWLYGAGRVLVGGNKIRGDGSLITWQYQALTDYGVLAEDEQGVPGYSTAVGREWGSSRSVLDKWKAKAAETKVEKYIDIKNFDDAAKAMIIANAFPCIASGQGFQMQLRHDQEAGCSWFIPSGTWMHQMQLAAIDYNMKNPRIFVGNQWSYGAHPGQLDGPNGGGWVRAEFFDKWLRQSGCTCLAMVGFNAWRMIAPNFSMR